MPNRLVDAASPYLRSHATNPVDWWPWGPEPFAEAARRGVPLLVSIGYSTCHWCHVMARESFGDVDVSAFMNERFVSIKVDREEHAEVDSTYMAAAAAFTGNLGWPLNVFVTPEGRAFFAGTYWPPEPVQGHPSFRMVLDAVTDAWQNRRVELERHGAAIVDALAQAPATTGSLVVDFGPIVAELERREDAEFGGFGPTRTSLRDSLEPVDAGPPKFPVAPVLRFLLERASVGDAAADALASRTLEATLGLRDSVDGGFFRYATRRDWSEPHYERMLYDNAQLLSAYAVAGMNDVAEGIADWITSMQQPEGAFASAQDSESMVDGARVEGFYYSLDAASRARVEAPPVDTKILTGWNGLAIEGLACAGRLLDRPNWIATARAAADFLLEHHVGHSLIRTSIDGVDSAARATLEDVGMLASGLIELGVATGEVRYAEAARRLIDGSLAASTAASATPAIAATNAAPPFGVPGGADPVLRAQGLVMQPEASDGALPSGLSAVASAAHRLFLLTAHEPYRAAASMAMTRVAEAAARQPISFGTALSVMSALAEPARQVVVISDDPMDASASLARHWYRSGGLLIALTTAQSASWAAAGFELLEGRGSSPGVATAYVCTDFVCRLPTTDPAELERQLAK
ncbi:thioredoxin domain-containing protein [Salinibacterium sp.]|uniref:thioredoxin domain-containing protein n=1 Tax=Salinibacterium sp. TaxID=1915057 RepID=UPI00286C8920|nr:thioredoxin domain-containing protein [Salinibacterium sp.]